MYAEEAHNLTAVKAEDAHNLYCTELSACPTRALRASNVGCEGRKGAHNLYTELSAVLLPQPADVRDDVRGAGGRLLGDSVNFPSPSVQPNASRQWGMNLACGSVKAQDQTKKTLGNLNSPACIIPLL